MSPFQAENSLNIFSRLDLFTSFSLTVPFNDTQCKSQATVGMTTGFRALFRDCDIRLFSTLSPVSLTVPDENSCQKVFQALTDNPSFGISASLSHYLHIPVVIQAGTLVPGGSWKRLSSPELSTSISPFSKSFSLRQGLSSSLPGPFTGERPFAGYISAGIPETAGLFKDSAISLFYQDDGTCAASAVCSINIPHMIRTEFSFTGGRFFLSNTLSSWFSDTAFFHADWFPAFSVQALFHSQTFMSLLTVNAYEQPFSQIRYTYRSENKLTFRRFIFILAGFAADGKNIRCPDNSLLTTLGQLQAASQYTWKSAFLRQSSLTTGTSCLIQHRYDKKKRCTYDDIKYAFGIHYTGRQMSAGLTCKASNLSFPATNEKDKETPEYCVSARFSKRKGLLFSAATGTGTFSDSSAKEIFKATMGINNNILCASGSASISCSQNNSEYKDGTVSVIFSCSRLSKFFRYTARIVLKSTF